MVLTQQRRPPPLLLLGSAHPQVTGDETSEYEVWQLSLLWKDFICGSVFLWNCNVRTYPTKPRLGLIGSEVPGGQKSVSPLAARLGQ